MGLRSVDGAKVCKMVREVFHSGGDRDRKRDNAASQHISSGVIFKEHKWGSLQWFFISSAVWIAYTKPAGAGQAASVKVVTAYQPGAKKGNELREGAAGRLGWERGVWETEQPIPPPVIAWRNCEAAGSDPLDCAASNDACLTEAGFHISPVAVRIENQD